LRLLADREPIDHSLREFRRPGHPLQVEKVTDR
jgi:hypothetical protein